MTYIDHNGEEQFSTYRMVRNDGRIETPDYMRAFLYTLKPEPGVTLRIFNPFLAGWEDVRPEPKNAVDHYLHQRHDRKASA